MIDKQPSPGNWTEYLMDAYAGPEAERPSLSYRPSYRVSALLGPDGEPLLVPIPRVAIGFDLRKEAGQ